jgi:hypothetical protein
LKKGFHRIGKTPTFWNRTNLHKWNSTVLDFWLILCLYQPKYENNLCPVFCLPYPLCLICAKLMRYKTMTLVPNTSFKTRPNC